MRKFCEKRNRRVCEGDPTICHSGAREVASPESMAMIGRMDSGFALRAPRNDKEVWIVRYFLQRALKPILFVVTIIR